MSLRGLPRAFVEGADPEGVIPLPDEISGKFRHVLRLSHGDPIAILPGDGALIEATLGPRSAIPVRVHILDTEPKTRVTVAQSFPKGDKLDDILRSCTELGVSAFALFPSDRTVVRWDEAKLESKLRRLRAIVTEAAETAFRGKIPSITIYKSLAEVLKSCPNPWALSESEGLERRLNFVGDEITLIVGPEGGWSPKEMAQIAPFAVSLGPRVLRTEHAGFAAAAIVLSQNENMPR